MLNDRPQVRQMKAMARDLSEGRAKIASPAPVQKGTNRTGLPDALKAGIENLSGLAMDDVRVHRNSAKPEQMQALAYTQGTEIHLGPGQEQHLAHEAWHVVQQKQGRVRPTFQLKGMEINDDPGLEREADSFQSRPPAPKAGRVAAARPVVQRRLQVKSPKVLTKRETQWNALRDFADTLPAGFKGPANTYGNANEGQMLGDFNLQITAMQGLKHAIIYANEKIDESACADLEWADIIDYLENKFKSDLVKVNITKNTDLGGNHGKGDYWKATEVISVKKIQTGTVAYSTHGKKTGLVGARGSVKEVIVKHNDLLKELTDKVATLTTE